MSVIAIVQSKDIRISVFEASSDFNVLITRLVSDYLHLYGIQGTYGTKFLVILNSLQLKIVRMQPQKILL